MTPPKTTKFLSATVGALLLAGVALPVWAMSVTLQEEVFQGISRNGHGEAARDVQNVIITYRYPD